METKKGLIVPAIENGTVIDHIPTEKVYQVISVLGLENYADEVLIGNYLQSGKLGRKGIVKIKNKHFTKEDVSKVALIAPFVTVITIKDYQVIEKFSTEIPDHVENFVKCSNPKCITNCEDIPTRFDIVEKDPLKLRCHYCEKYTTKETIHFINK